MDRRDRITHFPPSIHVDPERPISPKFRILENEAPVAGGRRIVKEQVEAALADLTASGTDLETAVHDARKRLRKVRALLRLVRGEVGEAVYRRESDTCREVRRRLSPLRDRCVLVRALEGVADGATDVLVSGACRLALARLVTERRQTEAEMVATLPFLSEELRRVRGWITRWPSGSADYESVREGLERTYRKGRKRMASAYRDPRPESFHEWRKRAKDLWYQVRVLAPTDPPGGEPLVRDLGELSDLLGSAHDLFLLKTWALQAGIGSRRAAVLAEVIDDRCRRLQAASRPLGEGIYDEKPSRFADRVADAWLSRRGEPGLRRSAAVLTPSAIRASAPSRASGSTPGASHHRPDPGRRDRR